MHNKTIFASENITGRKRREEEPWSNTTVKSAPRCEKCDGFVEAGQKFCNICRLHAVPQEDNDKDI
jgi:hypothetical protein